MHHGRNTTSAADTRDRRPILTIPMSFHIWIFWVQDVVEEKNDPFHKQRIIAMWKGAVKRCEVRQNKAWAIQSLPKLFALRPCLCRVQAKFGWPKYWQISPRTQSALRQVVMDYSSKEMSCSHFIHSSDCTDYCSKRRPFVDSRAINREGQLTTSVSKLHGYRGFIDIQHTDTELLMSLCVNSYRERKKERNDAATFNRVSTKTEWAMSRKEMCRNLLQNSLLKIFMPGPVRKRKPGIQISSRERTPIARAWCKEDLHFQFFQIKTFESFNPRHHTRSSVDYNSDTANSSKMIIQTRTK